MIPNFKATSHLRKLHRPGFECIVESSKPCNNRNARSMMGTGAQSTVYVFRRTLKHCHEAESLHYVTYNPTVSQGRGCLRPLPPCRSVHAACGQRWFQHLSLEKLCGRTQHMRYVLMQQQRIWTWLLVAIGILLALRGHANRKLSANHGMPTLGGFEDGITS